MILTMRLLAARPSRPTLTAVDGSMSTPGGDFPITFVFKAAGDKLTGTMLGVDGMEIPIANGKIEGDRSPTASRSISAGWRGDDL